jgi:hypothetical protein
VSSGAVSFAKIYSSLNEILRRGGKFKNGAVVVYLDANHPDLPEFLALKPSEAPWIKKAVYVDSNPKSSDYIMNNPHLDAILDGVRYGTVWLAKKRWEHPDTHETIDYAPDPANPDNYRLYSNVCLEILLPNRGTCTLSHVNLGQCNLKTIRRAFRRGMKFLCELHGITGAGRDNYYLSPTEDKQVGLGVFGLANLLARYKVSYSDFTFALQGYLNLDTADELNNKEALQKYYGKKAVALVEQIYLGFQDAAKIARRYKMKRAFTVAPTASCSFRYQDLDGYTTTPEISPPICHAETKKTVRDSSTFGQVEYQYPLNVETAASVGWDIYETLVENWQDLMATTGLAHSISFNIWNQCPVDREWFEGWLEGSTITTYYRMLVEQDFVDKSTVGTGLEDDELLASTQDFFMPVDDEDSYSIPLDLENDIVYTDEQTKTDFLSMFGSAAKANVGTDIEPGAMCTETMCVACAE